MKTHQVLMITSGRELFRGTELECKRYKRQHYDRFSRIYAI